MPDMSLKQLVSELKEALGDNLVSVTLYGPTALEEASRLPEDVEHPILIVMEELGLESLRKLASPIQKWRGSGHPKPLVFTRERLKHSSESFPVELLDMKEARRVLHGEDSILKLEVRRTHFQQELAANLKTELLALRSSFLENHGDGSALRKTLVDSLSGLRLLLRATLRMFVPVCPSTHRGVLESLKIHLPVDASVYEEVEALRHAEAPEGIEDLFVCYIREVEKLIDGTDALRVKRGGATYPPFRG